MKRVIPIDEYSVEFTGSIGVEAETAEEAKQKAREEVHIPFGGDIHSSEAENLDDTETFFQLKLSRVGTPYNNGSYGLWRGKSAMKLAYDAVNAIIKNMMPEQHQANFKYDLACLLLSSLTGDGLKGERLEVVIQEMKDDVHENGVDAIEEMYALNGEDSREKGENQ